MSLEELESIEKVKYNIKKSKIDDIIKNKIIQSILDLETNMVTLIELEKEYSKSHITFDTYITRKKMLAGEQIRIKDSIQNYLTSDLEKEIEKKDKGVLARLKRSIDENANWISILLAISQLLVSLSGGS